MRARFLSSASRVISRFAGSFFILLIELAAAHPSEGGGSTWTAARPQPWSDRWSFGECPHWLGRAGRERQYLHDRSPHWAIAHSSQTEQNSESCSSQ